MTKNAEHALHTVGLYCKRPRRQNARGGSGKHTNHALTYSSADEIYWTLCVNQAAGNVERMEAFDRIKDAAGLVVAAIRHPMAGDTKSADQHWKLTGSPLARFLM